MSSSPADSLSHLPDHLAGYANELAAAQKRLGAGTGDLAALLDLIIQRPTTRDQVCDLLEKSWRHLQTLRELLTTLERVKTGSAEVTETLTIAYKAIEANAPLSFTKLKDALDDAGAHLKKSPVDSRLQSRLAEANALACCLERRYDSAA